MIRVLLAEDQSMVLGALAALLELEPDIEVVGRAHDGREALALLATARPDVVLTDIEMPNLTGLELAAELKRGGARRGSSSSPPSAAAATCAGPWTPGPPATC